MATLSITVPDAQVPRVLTAYGARLGLTDQDGNARDATADEIRQYLVDRIRADVRIHELREARLAADAGITEVDATV